MSYSRGNVITKVLLLLLLCGAMVTLAYWTAAPGDFWPILGVYGVLTVAIAAAHYNLRKRRR